MGRSLSEKETGVLLPDGLRDRLQSLDVGFPRWSLHAMSRSAGVCPVHPLGPIALASLTTYWRGIFHVTVVAKTTFAFALNAEMPLVAPRDIVRTDVHFDDQRTRSVDASSDLAPHLGSAEVLFQGHAHAPGGVPTPHMHVRLGLAGDRGMVLDKRLVVIGDRDHPGAEPRPFVKMRIGYERTAGGPGNPENPIGVGFTGGAPNVQYPDAARASKPAAFGPLAAAWPCRASLLRGHEPFAFGGDPVTLPDDLDWRYFQAAPLDQWLPALPDCAWILLDGLHPEHASLRMRLPQLRVSARLYFAHGADTPIDLRADTLSIDGPSQRCTLTWRGDFRLAHAAVLAEVVVVAAGVHAPGQAPAWPVIPSRPRTATAPAPYPPVPSPAAPEPPRSMRGPPPVDLASTAVVSPDLLQRTVTPFRTAEKAPQRGPATTAFQAFDGGPPPMRAPFPLAAAGSTPSKSPALDFPGAPWAVTAAPIVPQPEEHQDMTAIMASPWSGTGDLPPLVAQPSSGPSPPIAAPPLVAKPPSVLPPPMVAPPSMAKPPSVLPSPPPTVSASIAAPAIVASATSPPAAVPPPALPANVPLPAPPPSPANLPSRPPPPSPANAPLQAPRRAASWRKDVPSPVASPSPPAPVPAPEPPEDLYGGFGPER
jgi:hypothetical protein